MCWWGIINHITVTYKYKDWWDGGIWTNLTSDGYGKYREINARSVLINRTVPGIILWHWGQLAQSVTSALLNSLSLQHNTVRSVLPFGNGPHPVLTLELHPEIFCLVGCGQKHGHCNNLPADDWIPVLVLAPVHQLIICAQLCFPKILAFYQGKNVLKVLTGTWY